MCKTPPGRRIKPGMTRGKRMNLDFTDILSDCVKNGMTAEKIAQAFVDRINKAIDVPATARIDEKNKRHIHFDYCVPVVETRQQIDSLKIG